MMMMRLAAALIAITGMIWATPSRADCALRDFMALPLPLTSDNIATALELAYPGSRADTGAGLFTAPDGQVILLLPARAVSDRARLDRATIGDMFAQAYPLDGDRARRLTPWADPGRARNDAFFRALYGDTAAQVGARLTTVRYQGQTVAAAFQVTTRACVAVQLQAALSALQAMSPGIDPLLTDVGGSFNWRLVAGTDRLSSHSFGAAIDLNAGLGGYWRWTGAAEGAVGPMDNHIPPPLVVIMQRYGFVWGGNWHHFDGMHFEYRPELILFARLNDG